MKKPIVTRITYTAVAVSEIAARVCYDSFHKGNRAISDFGIALHNTKDKCKLMIDESTLNEALTSTDTSLVEKLVWVNHHESIVEHVNVTFLATNVSRGVLHHQARHRMQALSVQSTRYTMVKLALMLAVLKHLKLINNDELSISFIVNIMKINNILCCTSDDDILTESTYFFTKVSDVVKEANILDLMSKEQYEYMVKNISVKTTDIYKEIDIMYLQKNKRNVGDLLKDGVTDTWNTTFIATMNMRSLKNYLKLRNSGASLSRTQDLAIEIQNCLPDDLLKLVVK